MILIGESLNVISKKIGKAFKERDPKPIQEEALFQKEKRMDYIDINLGPGQKRRPRVDALGGGSGSGRGSRSASGTGHFQH